MASGDEFGLLDQEPDRRDDFGSEQFIAKRRGSAVVDDLFGGSDLQNDVSVGLDGTDATITPSDSLSRTEQRQFEDTVQGVAYELGAPSQDGFLIDNERLNDVPNPRKVHNARSEDAKRQDERLSAPLTNNPQTYANAPDEYDWPGVDTPPGTEGSEASALDDFESLF